MKIFAYLKNEEQCLLLKESDSIVIENNKTIGGVQFKSETEINFEVFSDITSAKGNIARLIHQVNLFIIDFSNIEEGLSLVNILKERIISPNWVFANNSRQNLLTLLHLQPSGYIEDFLNADSFLKPIKNFLDAEFFLYEHFLEENSILFKHNDYTKHNKTYTYIKSQNILYLEISKNHINVHQLVFNAQIETSTKIFSMKKMEEFIPMADFLKCNDHIIVNMYFIESIVKEKTGVRILLKHNQNNEDIYCSKSRIKHCIEQYIKWKKFH